MTRQQVGTGPDAHVLQTVLLGASAYEDREYPILRNIVDAPIVTLAETSATSLYWPQLIDRKIGNPAVADSARIALVFSTDHATSYTTHSNSGIFAMTAPHPLGPWTNVGKIYIDNTSGTETETPRIVWDPAAALWRMFYQQAGVSGAVAGQSTLMATATDILGTWTRVGMVIDGPAAAMPGNTTHSGYFQPFRVAGRWWGWNIGGGSDYGNLLYASEDLVNWQLTPHRVSREQHLLSQVTGFSAATGWLWRWTTSDVIQFRGQTMLIGAMGAQSSGADETPLRFGVAPLAPSLTRLAARPVDITPPNQSWMTVLDSAGFGLTFKGRTYKPFRANTKYGNLGIWEVV